MSSIRWKLLVTMIGLIAGLLIALTWITINGQSRMLNQALERWLDLQKEILVETGRTLSRTLGQQAENDVAAFSYSTLARSLQDAVDENDALSFVILMDDSSGALIHTQHPELQQETLSNPEDVRATRIESSTYYQYGEGDHAVLEFVEPIEFGGRRWGTLRLGFSLAALNREIQETRQEIEEQISKFNEQSTTIAIGFLLFSVMLVLWQSQKLTDPIIRLTDSVRRLADGDFAVADEMQTTSRDEVGYLYEAFIAMAGNLKHQTQRLEQLTNDLRGVLDQAPEGVLVHEDGVITYANSAICKSLGTPPEAVLRQQLLDWVLPADRSLAEAVLRGEIEDSRGALQWRMVDANGKVAILEVTPVESIEFGGRPASMLLTRDMTARRELEREIVQISTEEQERFAHDLHDGLGQILTGVAYRGKMLEQLLRDRDSVGVEEAEEIVKLANEAASQARTLARGLDPVELSEEGLVLALNALAHRTQDLFGAQCTFDSTSAPVIRDKFTATHLYRIALEAVTNAVKHGKAESIEIELKREEREISLIIRDDGKGITQEQGSTQGVGLRNMRYRAKMIGGSLRLSNADGGGTLVTCSFHDSALSDWLAGHVVVTKPAFGLEGLTEKDDHD